MRFLEQRKRAKQRKIPWELEYWEWLQIWQDSGRIHERGRAAGQWVMARHGDQGAYEAGNVAIVRVNKNNSDAAKGRVIARREAAGKRFT